MHELSKGQTDHPLNKVSKYICKHIPIGRNVHYNVLEEDKMHLELYSQESKGSTFHLHINSKGISFSKSTFYHREESRNIGLLRIDYTMGCHTNPPYSSNLPGYLKPYGNKRIVGNHIHIHIEGYKLNWAIPLEDSDFPVKNLESNDINSSFVEAVTQFAERINLINKIEIIYEPTLPFQNE